MNNKKKCFVIMPVSATKSCTESEWNGIYEHMIKPAVTGSRLGYNCERSKPMTGAFIRDILDGLNRADVVIADLTDRNPNVCYELGIRHTLKKRTILIAQNIEDVPSDLQSYWVVTYKKDLTGASEFKKRVREILREMQKDPEKSDSPVADFLGIKNIYISSYEKSANLKKLAALISELSYNIHSVDDVLEEVAKSEQSRKKNKSHFRVSLVRFSNSCLELLFSTSYLILPQEVLTFAKLVNENMGLLNADLDLWGQPAFTQQVEKKLKEVLPVTKKQFASLLEKICELRADYVNDNYQEPTMPPIILSSPEHEKYLQLTE